MHVIRGPSDAMGFSIKTENRSAEVFMKTRPDG
jgi:hypothetical protein